ncbi:putative Quinate/shikimate 5-dehydrogenase/glutamyl-tRNA reductase domain-containing protein [Seiridium cardinale]|uniref:Quinate/shikimate 5-dehydrogenase/glutamyl-tRNA reductase domain-containing protein n=1 Tax=Seiridium cardinale TaxID=138064 RepID=A0ABR2XKS4_9PEZI
MSLTVLTDGDVKKLLVKLTSEEISSLFSALGSGFVGYSIGQENQYQCHRQGVTRPGGPTMLFMPATLPRGSSVKVVGVPPPRTESSGPQSKPIVGAIMICDNDGRAVGLINAAETTAFRTSLGSILLYQFRERTEHIVVFGAGKQALWHLRLALVLKSTDIRTVTIVNRSIQRSQGLIDRLREMDGEGGSTTTANIAFSLVDASTDSTPGYQDRLRDLVQQADTIFCTTPSTSPLFPAEWLTSAEGRQKTRFISAIGSYKLDMQEIDPTLLRAVTTDPESNFPGLYRPKEKPSENGGILVVDSREACALEAGELVKAEIKEEDLVEVGELLQIQEHGGSEEKKQLAAWLKNGSVIYKSVGIGLMDLAIGGALLELAASGGVGVKVDDF